MGGQKEERDWGSASTYTPIAQFPIKAICGGVDGVVFSSFMR